MHVKTQRLLINVYVHSDTCYLMINITVNQVTSSHILLFIKALFPLFSILVYIPYLVYKLNLSCEGFQVVIKSKKKNIYIQPLTSFLLSTGSFCQKERQRKMYLKILFILSGNCLLVKKKDHGTLTSPDYPKTYFGNEQCRLEVWTTPGQRLQVKFKVQNFFSSNIMN